MTYSHGLQQIRQAAAIASSAIQDAKSDPSSYVARDIAVIANNAEIEQTQIITPFTSEILQHQTEKAFQSLGLSGYIFLGHDPH